jgi:gas vesicle protein
MNVTDKKNEESQNNEADASEKADENTEKEPVAAGSQIQLAVIGGVVGAGLGLLSNPGTGKKVAERLGQSEVMKMAGRELRTTLQDVIRDQATSSLRKAATGYLGSKAGGSLLKLRKGTSSSGQSDDQSDGYEELKEENKNLNDRLSSIEEKLDKLLKAK